MEPGLGVMEGVIPLTNWYHGTCVERKEVQAREKREAEAGSVVERGCMLSGVVRSGLMVYRSAGS